MNCHRQHLGNRAGEADHTAVCRPDRSPFHGCNVDAPVTRIGTDRREVTDNFSLDRQRQPRAGQDRGVGQQEEDQKQVQDSTFLPRPRQERIALK